jgi:D-lactate dehydrogenase (cytochrome)
MIGGMVGTGCSGTNAYRYGTMKNWVVALTVVLADGTIIKTRQRPMKSSAGYDMTRLFVGNEGTLGLVTEAVLRVTVLPQNTRVAVAAFPTIHQAAECVDKVVQKGIQVAAVELLDENGMKCINASGATDREWQETPTIFFKFTGTESGVQEEIQVVQDMAKEVGNKEFIFAQDEQEAEDLWQARKTILWGAQIMKKHDDDHTWITDVAVPMSRLPEMIEATKKDFRDVGLPAAVIGHVGDGNFHSMSANRPCREIC